MNAAAKQKMDWSKRSAHQWLEQYGLWVRSGGFKHSANPIAVAMDQADITRIRSSKISTPCEITDFEAVEVGKLLAKMNNDSREYLAERAWFLILKYENNLSYRVIANTHGTGKDTVRTKIDLGLAYLDGVIELKAEV
ncbi:antiterminator Q family protein [Acinetobacter sp. ANC5681]|uniref:antiterminator Q family protein n=1 Tax=Acinetobacter sp. ANC5681 TaxID=2929504 RepID=UPI00201B262C|nr:antiterminator Q family protein [Acinetobacter sp. ANC5681]MCL5769444.1 antitermination protein [Acinetobacter sp. ANC5681]